MTSLSYSSSPLTYTDNGITYKKYHSSATEHLLETLELSKQHGSRICIPLYMMGGSGQVYTVEDINIMREIVSNGGSVPLGPINKYSDTALHLACCHDNQPMIDFLIENGADINAKRYNGQKPHELQFKGERETLEEGITVYSPDGNVPIMKIKSGDVFNIKNDTDM